MVVIYFCSSSTVTEGEPEGEGAAEGLADSGCGVGEGEGGTAEGVVEGTEEGLEEATDEGEEAEEGTEEGEGVELEETGVDVGLWEASGELEAVGVTSMEEGLGDGLRDDVFTAKLIEGETVATGEGLTDSGCGVTEEEGDIEAEGEAAGEDVAEEVGAGSNAAT